MKNKKEKKIFGFYIRQLQQWFLYWLVLGVGFIVLVFLITSTWIGVSVHEKCLVAEGKYGGDCVESLMATLDDQVASNRERNYAIWALGQLGDERALPVLNKYYTGVIPDREPYDMTLSQYEMKKAIKLLDGGFNATAPVWRGGLE